MCFKAALLASLSCAILASPALSQNAAETGASSGSDAGISAKSRSSEIVVKAKRLDEARASIQPSLGATSYTMTKDTIQALPGGDNQQFNQVLLQLPGVVQDGFGQFHVRDDHNNLQYRINGTILPEGLAVFGQTLSPRLVEKLSLVTGALPAQYGLRTAGIIDITTKSGLFENGGEVSLYGGSQGLITPAFNYGGSSGSTNYFVSGSYRHSDLGIESVDGSRRPLHDTTDQGQAFAYVDHIIDDSNRISFIGGYSNQHFQIPDPHGLNAAVDGLGYSVRGVTDYASEALKERQVEKTGFGQIAWLHDAGPLSVQTSVFARYSSLDYYPDTLGELLFNGVAQRATKHDLTIGGQIDAAYRLSSVHTLRFGALITGDRGKSWTTTQVFPVNANGAQTGEPFGIVDNGAKTEMSYSAYLQDEWKILPSVTLNFGGRFDHYDGYRSESQFSPRVNAVWQPTPFTTIHAGYSRYFSPPPFELVATTTVQKFDGTSGAGASDVNTTPFAERQDYFDAGFQQKVGTTGLTFGVDGYYRRSKNLIDEGQFGAPIILQPFNYAHGRIHGVEANISYLKGPLMAYANFAYAKGQGRNIVSSQFNFAQSDIDYIQNNYIYLDHDQTYTASGGFSYALRGTLKGLKLGIDALYGSGLRTSLIYPNDAALPDYVQVNLSASYRIEHAGVTLRFDIINVGDHVYEIRDGGGVGVGAPQYGPRRGFFGGITKSF